MLMVAAGMNELINLPGEQGTAAPSVEEVQS
jgi:hypothetical protein